MDFFMSMSMEIRGLLFLLPTIVWLLLNNICYGVESDIQCLKALKSSLEDPFNYLKGSWDFSNSTEGFICKFNGIECWHPGESKVLNIQLSNMGLKGQFPKGIENCTSLTGLDLSSNDLSGPLPQDISRIIPFMTTLDLSSNGFSGGIPVNLSNCAYLNVLNLQKNRLTGPIPGQFTQLKRLMTLNVANNRLSGQIPTFNKTFPASSFVNNSGLCGKPLAECKGPLRKIQDHKVQISA